MHRKIKVYLGHGLGNLLYLAEAMHEALEDTAKELRLEEARQKTLLLQKFNRQKWLGRVSHQVSWPALEILASTRQHALKMLQKKSPTRLLYGFKLRLPYLYSVRLNLC
jgi:hypothetical protein